MSNNRRWIQLQRDREKQGWQAKKPGRKARHSAFLTDEFVASLVADGTEYAVRDTIFPAFGVRVYTSGTKTYFFRPQERGTKKIIFLGRSSATLAAEARSRAQSIERRFANGGSIAEFSSPSTSRKVDDAFRVYIDGWSGSSAWRKKIENVFGRAVLPCLGHKMLTDLRAEDFETVFEEYRSSYGRRQCRYMASAFLTWCTKTGRLKTNVLKGLPSHPPTQRSRNPVDLDAVELALVWDACDLLPENWTQVIRLVIALAEPIDNVLKLDSDGRSSPDGPVHRHLRTQSFSREYFRQIAEGRDGLLFVGRDHRSPMQFQSRMIERIRAELYWMGRFSMGDIVQASSRHLTTLRQPNTEWNELHPRAVRFVNAPLPVEDEVEI